MSKSFNSELQGSANNSMVSTPMKRARGQYREDNEAELETLRNVKIFLTDKLKQNEQITCTFQQDVNILKEVIRVEKQITQKTQAQLKTKDADLKQLRQDFTDMEQKLREKVNTLSLRDQELTQQVDSLNTDKKKLKGHKKMLREEVIRQREQI